MKAMILASGMDSRMSPLTLKIPKSMLNIANKPNLEYVLELCCKNQIDDVMISLFHLPEQVDHHFGNGTNHNIKITYSIEKNLLGTAGSVKRVESFFDDTFFVLMGDGLTNIDLTEMLKFHRQNNSKATIAVKEMADPPLYGTVLSDTNSRILSFQEKPSLVKAKSNLANIGVYILEPEILNLIPSKTNFEFGNHLFPELLENKIPFYAYKTTADWNDIGNLREYWKINLDIASGNAADYLLYTNKKKDRLNIHKSVNINRKVLQTAKSPVLIGKNVEIKSGVEIRGPVVIGDNVFIDKGAVVDSSVVLNDTYIGKNIEVKESIINQNDHVSIPNNFSTVLDDNSVLSEFKRNTFQEILTKYFINATDRTIAFFALLFLSPLFLLVAIIIKLDSKGPVFYISKRSKSPETEMKKSDWYLFKHARIVKYYVFRTMINNASKAIANLENKYKNGPYIKIEDDPRVTKFGRILRKTSIDELPLLWNVLKGDMSLVGIWALPTYEAEHILKEGLKSSNSSDGVDLSDVARVRFDGKIGLAGYWQARGRSNLTAEERAIHDTFQTVVQNPRYSDNKFMGDYSKYRSYPHYWKMLFDTFKSVILRTGAV